MNRDFGAELIKFCKSLDAPLEPTEHKEEVREGPLFNVHKRTLPVDVDVIVEFGLTESEAKMSLFNRNKTRVRNDDVLVYYDIVAQDADDKLKSVYYNDKNTITE